MNGTFKSLDAGARFIRRPGAVWEEHPANSNPDSLSCRLFFKLNLTEEQKAAIKENCMVESNGRLLTIPDDEQVVRIDS